MTARARALQLCGASLPAIAASLLFSPSQANACTAFAKVRNDVQVVDIVCTPGAPDVAPFLSSSGAITGNGNDTLTMSGGAVLTGAATTPAVSSGGNLDPSAGVIDLLDGDDVVTISGGTIGSTADPLGLVLGAGADTFGMSGGTITGSVFGLGGGNTYTVSGGTILGSLFAGSQNDVVTISGTANIRGDASIGPDSVGLEDGDDVFTMTGGTLVGAVSGGNDNDLLRISGGTIGGFVSGNDGVDRIEISGGTIAGDVEAETVVLTGGTIGGDIAGISSTTLIINDAASPDPLNLRNGVLISGVNGFATITDTDLAAGGTKTVVFDGFGNVTTNNSTLGFGTATQGIEVLNLTNGSTLFANGNVNLAGSFATVTNSTITMIDGVTDDVLTAASVALANGTIGLDVNQQTLSADRIVAAAFGGTGVNTVSVNLLGNPVFTGQTDIPIVFTGGPVTGTFLAAGLPGTQASLFAYQVLPVAGGLIVRATPANVGLASAVQNAVDVSTHRHQPRCARRHQRRCDRYHTRTRRRRWPGAGQPDIRGLRVGPVRAYGT